MKKTRACWLHGSAEVRSAAGRSYAFLHTKSSRSMKG